MVFIILTPFDQSNLNYKTTDPTNLKHDEKKKKERK